jgi:methionyl-tRNA synthetase
MDTPPAPPAPPPEPTLTVNLSPLKDPVTIDDFARLDLRVGLVVEAGPVEGAKKLVRLGIDLGEGRLRNVFAGIRAAYPDPSVLVGKRLVVVANLKPREMKWGVSEGMVLAAGNPDQGHTVVTAADGMRPGSTVT